MNDYEIILDKLRTSKFRNSFHLKDKELKKIQISYFCLL